MAIGKKNRFSGSKAYFAKIITKRDGKFLPLAEFQISVKGSEGEYKPLTAEALKELTGEDGPVRDVVGDLVSIDTRVGHYEDDPIYNVSLGLEDKGRGEIYFTDFTVGSSLGRNLANSVLNLQAFNNVQVGLYGNKGTEGKIYSNVALRQGQIKETVKWKFKMGDENLKPREFEGKGGKMEKDYTKVDLFLFEQLEKLGNSLKTNADIPQKESVDTRETVNEQPKYDSPTSESQPDEEELPF